MKVVKSGEELLGKKIKYCNIFNMNDNDLVNLIIAEDNTLLAFFVNNYTYCLSEKEIKRKILTDSIFRKELFDNNVLDDNILKEIENEYNKLQKEKKDKLKNERYKKYLELKKEFEG